MTNRIYTIFKDEIDKIVSNHNTISVFLVGSSKKIDFEAEDVEINDIDIFVFVNQGENQVRIVKAIDDIEFDINYFSRIGFKYLMDNKEYFFLKEMKDAKVIFDRNSTGQNIIMLCKRKYLEGPDRMSSEEKQFMKSEFKSKLDRLENKEKFDEFEYDFLMKLYLKDMINGYFTIKDSWVPKDKKLLKILKEEDKYLYDLVKESYINCEYEDILKVYDYIFKDIRLSSNIKITY